MPGDRLSRGPKWFHVKTVLTGSVCSPETQNSPGATWQGGRETSGLLTPSLAGAASFFPVLNTVKVCSNENSTAEKKYHKLEDTQLQLLLWAWPSLHPLPCPGSGRRLGPLKAHPSPHPKPANTPCLSQAICLARLPQQNMNWVLPLPLALAATDTRAIQSCDVTGLGPGRFLPLQTGPSLPGGILAETLR